MTDSQSVNLLTEAEQVLSAVLPPACGGLPRAAGAFPLEDFGHRTPPAPAHPSHASGSGQLDLRIELGRTRMRPGEVRKLRSGSVIPLDKLAGEPVDLHAGGRRIARGELLVLDGKIAVRVVELAGY
jgi:flagellar motor switch protein FliN/FliY